MNYRHAYHAGNVGDVLKHVVLVALFDRLLAKPAPLFFMDTHAGRGRYDLRSSEATRGAEWMEGIGRLLAADRMPPEVERYLALVRSFNAGGPDSDSRFYPGSPALAFAMLRKEDRKVFVEKHPEEASALRDLMRGRRNLSVLEEDGYVALKGQMPPRENRGLVLVDPPFESTSEFDDLAGAIGNAWRRWPNGLFCAWYPIKADHEAARFHRAIVEADIRKTLVLELSVKPHDSPTGLIGSGLLLVNPPWQLDDRMRIVLPALHQRLSPSGAGMTRVDWLVGE
jgi:23S rRNA (adenine2030-N6)-methyltransferase